MIKIGQGLFCLFCCFTSQVNSYGHYGTVSSPNHTFPGQDRTGYSVDIDRTGVSYDKDMK